MFMKKLTKERIKAPFLAAVPMIIVLVFSVIAILVVTIISLAVGKDPDNISEWTDFLCMEFAMLAGAATAVALVNKRNKTRLRDFMKIKDFDIMVPIMLLLFGWSAGEICDHIGALVLSQFMTVEPNVTDLSHVTSILSAVICAPIFEELLFRFAGSELGKGAYSIPVICVANSIFFAAVHGYNIQGFGNVLVGAVCMAYVYCKTGNLLYTMLEHALHNALCIIDFEQFSLFGTPLYYEKNGFVFSGWWWLAINAVVLVVCLVYYFKVFRKKYVDDKFKVNRETGLPDTAIAAEEIAEDTVTA